MEISQTKSGDLLIVSLKGRLDASWCGHVEDALIAAVRGGEHHIQVDMAEVNYVSSAGLRVLLVPYKQLRSIQGSFAVINASPTVRTVLELAGLGMVMAHEEEIAVAPMAQGRAAQSAHATYQVFTSAADAMRLTLLAGAEPKKVVCEENDFALGIGALGTHLDECVPRLGEFLAVGGMAAFQPSDGSSRPDFIVKEGSLRPEGFLSAGVTGTGTFPILARFEAAEPRGRVGLTELAEKALELGQAPAAIVVAATETTGLVGATLRKPPVAGKVRFDFPEIRDWLSFTSERSYRDTTSLLVGVVARPGSALDPILRPYGANLVAHFHAAVFPYIPLQKGPLQLKACLGELLQHYDLQAVLHLISDLREFHGAGESEFLRGAMWIAPLPNPTPA